LVFSCSLKATAKPHKPVYQSDLKHSNKTLEEKLHQLYTLSGKKNLALDLFREPYIQLLEAFGNPQDNLPPVIHVAGTNGKGSIIATLKSIYEAAGYNVHVYTSPHLIRFNERIVLAGKQIDNESLEALIDETLELNAGRDATFFEATTAMAFAAFTRTQADICLLEVGLGGRLDCTNIIQNPAACIINTIGIDHTDFLGDTIKEIAGEKAGIMKDQTPCIIGSQNHDDVFEVFESKAKDVGATLVQSGSHLERFDPPALKGEHQRGNINTALTALETLQEKFPVSDKHINQGLKSINWPARMQQLPSKGLGFEGDTKIWLDGGHNEDAGKAIANTLKELKQDGAIAVILCMMKHKDPKGFVETFIKHTDNLYLTQLPKEPSSLSANELSTLLGDIDHTKTNAYKDALKQAKAKNPAHILITGSLYLAGHVLQDLEDSGHN